MNKKIIYLLLLVIAMGCTAKQKNEQAIQSGHDVLTAMHEAYKDKWYPYLTFKQKTNFYKDGEEVQEQIWHEALDTYRGLIIKFDSMDSGNGMIFKEDSQYVFRDGTLVNKIPRVHELIVLGFDVYYDDVSATAEKLESIGYDLDMLDIQMEKGKEVYVVGDPKTNQFWIDADKLVFERLVKVQPDGNISKIEFLNYEPLGESWLAPLIIFYTNGQMTMREEYYDIETPDSLPDNLLDTDNFTEITW